MNNPVDLLPGGYAIGHWSDREARTGCTVILPPPQTVGSCDVRGSSPGTRELALLAVDKTMQEVHALLLTGGSAFGLAAADGVVRFLEERGIGYQTPWGRVPIVPAAVIFDLNVGASGIRPSAPAGYEAAAAAREHDVGEGTIGAGTGASVGKWGGLERSMKGGCALASIRSGGVMVAAFAVVNAVGDVVDEAGGVIAGARGEGGRWLADGDSMRTIRRAVVIPPANTTLVALMTDARLTKVEANRVAQRGHNGLARSIRPVHTSYDGDAVFCLASGRMTADVDLVAEIGTEAASRAIRRAVKLANAG